MHAEAIAALEAIERSCDTAQLTYHDVNYWPLVRLRLWSALMQRLVLGKKADGGDAVANKPPAWSDAGPVTVEAVGPLGLLRSDARAATPGRPGLVVFARPEEHGETTPAGAYAKMLDSLLDIARDRTSTCKLELADPRTAGFKRALPSLFLNVESSGAGLRFDPPGELAHFREIEETAGKLADIALDEAALTNDMGRICTFARVFEHVLRTLGPKALALSVYYHPVGMAWMLACRRAGVASIDLQHGRLGPHHGLYTNLTAAPGDGYALMPDRIWCWGARTVGDIARDNNPACARHRGFVGGNPWLYKWRYGDSSAFAPAGLAAFETETAGKRKILVSLQPLDQPIAPELLAAMKAAPADWLWLLRLHPLRRQTAPEIAAQLARHGIAQFELERATTFPLFSLLRLADHHVTAFSSVTIEAAAFDLRTSLTAPEGVAAFGPELANGICRHTPTAKALLAHIHEVLAGPRQPLADDFIDMSRGVVTVALDEVLR